MPERNATDFLNLRLPLYAYTAPLWHGRNVLEIGCGDGASADYLASAGAARVLTVDVESARIDNARARHSRPRVEFRAVADLRLVPTLTLDERFDVVLIPEGQPWLNMSEALAGLRGLLTEGGHLVVAVPAADRKNRPQADGVGYYDLADTLAARFPVVRMLGQTPFLGFGLVEFDGSAEALRVDVSLLHGGSEQPSHYVAIAGASVPPALGYALIQVPFAPVESIIRGAAAAAVAAARPTPAVEPPAPIADGRAELAERRLEDAERRSRARLDEAEARHAELRRKLDEAMLQSESSVRVARVQGEEIDELRGRLRRLIEDRAASDADMTNLRRALAQADESVLTLTRRTAEEMAVIAQKMVSGFALSAGGGGVAGASSAETEASLRKAEEASARDRAELSRVTERLRAADDELRILRPSAAAIAARDDRIAGLEAEKQDLTWRVAEVEEKLRHAGAVAPRAEQPVGGDIAVARAARDRAIEELHRGAAAHAEEIQALQASVTEQAALVSELEDAVKLAEARAAAADKEASTLRRNAKELEDADRSRRGRLAELEGKLLRLERERAIAAAEGRSPGGAGTKDADATADLLRRLATAEQRAIVAEQRAVGAEERAAALAAAAVTAASEPPVPNGHHLGGVSALEIKAAIAEIEGRLREEMGSLSAIEEGLERAREAATRRAAAGTANPQANADLERALAAKDSQLIEGRLELARMRRDAEGRQIQLESEISDLRARLNLGGDASMSDDQGQSAQLILMHSTLANIRRRSARLRDELEGFRRRLDTLPPGALSSMLEEIGEDLAEFAK